MDDAFCPGFLQVCSHLYLLPEQEEVDSGTGVWLNGGGMQSGASGVGCIPGLRAWVGKFVAALVDLAGGRREWDLSCTLKAEEGNVGYN